MSLVFRNQRPATNLVFGSMTVAGGGPRYLSPSGVDSAAYGDTTLVLADQYLDLDLTGIEVVHDFGDAAVGYYSQDVNIDGYGVPSGDIPEPFIDFRVRTIIPPFIFALFWGDAEIAKVEILPDGLPNPTVFGRPRVEHNTRYLYQEPQFWPNLFGAPTVLNVNRYIPFTGIQAIEFGDTTIYNLLQQVTTLPFAINSPPNIFGDFAWVENRNRTLVPNNWTSSAFGRRTEMIVENQARAIYPSGFDAISWGDSFTSHWVRTLPLDGWDSFVSRHWHIVYNTAVVAAPPTIPRSDVVSTGAEVYNLNRTVRQAYGPSDMSGYGTAFIAPRVRTLTHYAAYPGAVSYIGNPDTFFAQRIIAVGEYIIRDHYGVPRPLGVFGPTTVTGPFIRTLKPTHSIGPPPDLIGLLEIVNRNRELRPRSITTRDEFGPFITVENFVRDIFPPSIGYSAPGWIVIQDRRQYATMPSVLSFVLPTSHQVRNLLPDPPSLQHIVLDSTHFVGPVPSLYSEIRTPTIYPGGDQWTSFGMATVRSTTLQVTKGIINLDQLGVPWVRGPQYIYGIGHQPSSDLSFPKCRLTPHTVYAPSGDQATEQAIANHPTPGEPNAIDPPAPQLGVASVDLKNRIIDQGSEGWGRLPISRVGTPQLDLFRRYVAQSPFQSLRFGLPVILGSERTIMVRPYLGDTEFGYADFSRPAVYTRYVEPVGFAGEFGTTQIDLWIRDIVVDEGIPHQSNPETVGVFPDDPFGTAWVSENPRVFQMDGFTEFGSGERTRVEHKIRTVYAIGHNSESFVLIDFPSFRHRMRVTQKYPVPVVSLGALSVFGTPSITHWVRTIIGRSFDPDPLGRPRVLGTYGLNPSGWESTEFGDIDEWEAGKIKPYGSLMGDVGEPRIAYPIEVSGFTGDVGDARVARVAYLNGIPPIAFDGPSVTDEFGCNNRVITPLPVSAPSIPSPAVA